MGLKNIYLVGHMIKKAEMEIKFQKSGFDLSCAFYKMRTSGKIFTFPFNLPEAQFPHL